LRYCLIAVLRFFPQKPQRDCATISSASPVNTRTAEWIVARKKEAPNGVFKFWVLGNIKKHDLRANVRSAVRVFTGEAGVTFAL